MASSSAFDSDKLYDDIDGIFPIENNFGHLSDEDNLSNNTEIPSDPWLDEFDVLTLSNSEMSRNGATYFSSLDESQLKEEAVDLFNELIVVEAEENKAKLEHELNYENMCCELEKLQKLDAEKDAKLSLLTIENINLKKNICSLYKTAKSEIEHKEFLLNEANQKLDAFLFKRRNYYTNRKFDSNIARRSKDCHHSEGEHQNFEEIQNDPYNKRKNGYHRRSFSSNSQSKSNHDNHNDLKNTSTYNRKGNNISPLSKESTSFRGTCARNTGAQVIAMGTRGSHVNGEESVFFSAKENCFLKTAYSRRQAFLLKKRAIQKSRKVENINKWLDETANQKDDLTENGKAEIKTKPSEVNMTNELEETNKMLTCDDSYDSSAENDDKQVAVNQDQIFNKFSDSDNKTNSKEFPLNEREHWLKKSISQTLMQKILSPDGSKSAALNRKKEKIDKNEAGTSNKKMNYIMNTVEESSKNAKENVSSDSLMNKSEEMESVLECRKELKTYSKCMPELDPVLECRKDPKSDSNHMEEMNKYFECRKDPKNYLHRAFKSTENGNKSITNENVDRVRKPVYKQKKLAASTNCNYLRSECSSYTKQDNEDENFVVKNRKDVNMDETISRKGINKLTDPIPSKIDNSSVTNEVYERWINETNVDVLPVEILPVDATKQTNSDEMKNSVTNSVSQKEINAINAIDMYPIKNPSSSVVLEIPDRNDKNFTTEVCVKDTNKYVSVGTGRKYPNTEHESYIEKSDHSTSRSKECDKNMRGCSSTSEELYNVHQKDKYGNRKEGEACNISKRKHFSKDKKENICVRKEENRSEKNSRSKGRSSSQRGKDVHDRCSEKYFFGRKTENFRHRDKKFSDHFRVHIDRMKDKDQRYAREIYGKKCSISYSERNISSKNTRDGLINKRDSSSTQESVATKKRCFNSFKKVGTYADKVRSYRFYDRHPSAETSCDRNSAHKRDSHCISRKSDKKKEENFKSKKISVTSTKIVSDKLSKSSSSEKSTQCFNKKEVNTSVEKSSVKHAENSVLEPVVYEDDLCSIDEVELSLEKPISKNLVNNVIVNDNHILGKNDISDKVLPNDSFISHDQNHKSNEMECMISNNSVEHEIPKDSLNSVNSACAISAMKNNVSPVLLDLRVTKRVIYDAKEKIIVQAEDTETEVLNHSNNNNDKSFGSNYSDDRKMTCKETAFNSELTENLPEDSFLQESSGCSTEDEDCYEIISISSCSIAEKSFGKFITDKTVSSNFNDITCDPEQCKGLKETSGIKKNSEVGQTIDEGNSSRPENILQSDVLELNPQALSAVKKSAVNVLQCDINNEDQSIYINDNSTTISDDKICSSDEENGISNIVNLEVDENNKSNIENNSCMHAAENKEKTEAIINVCSRTEKVNSSNKKSNNSIIMSDGEICSSDEENGVSNIANLEVDESNKSNSENNSCMHAAEKKKGLRQQ